MATTDYSIINLVNLSELFDKINQDLFTKRNVREFNKKTGLNVEFISPE
jgi:hypothetical protein